MEFRAKRREERKISVTFPNGTQKEFSLVDRSIGNQRKLLGLWKEMANVDATDAEKSLKAIDKVLLFIFPSSNGMKDFESLDEEDLVGLLHAVKADFDIMQKRTEDEKKNQSNEPILTNS